MSRKSFDKLLPKIQHRLLGTGRNPSALCPQEKLLIALYRLGSQGEQGKIAELVKRCPQTVCNCLDEVCEAIVEELQEEFIFLPSPEEMDELTLEFEKERRIPGAWGAIDGKHFQHGHSVAGFKKAKCPHTHSLVLLAICDICKEILRYIG